VREHSRKPDDQYTMVESLYAGPYAEIFSRNTRPGWDCWGDEAGKFAEPAA
jgi:N6-adenosine-specific RNA methylase IME4